MNDTPEYIRKKQFQIIHSKPLSERIRMMTDMTDLSRTLIENQIRRLNPNMSDGEVKIEVFKAFYRNDFDEETMGKIIDSFREYHQRNVRMSL